MYVLGTHFYYRCTG